MALRIPVNPRPGARPRVSKWGTYYPKTHKAYVAELHKEIPKPAGCVYPFEAVYVSITCNVQKPRTGKLSLPVGDVDNYAKPVLDVLTNLGYWTDDKQVAALFVSKEYADPGTAPSLIIKIES